MMRPEADHASPMQELMQGILAPSTPALPPPVPSTSGVVLSTPPNPPPLPPSASDANGNGNGTSDGQAPSWMLEAPRYSQASVRTGVTQTKGSGLHTLLFFAVIIIIVGAAGVFGVVMWGPEKPTVSHSHLASNPPAPTPLPSLSASADLPPPVATESPASPADSAAPSKKTKKQRGKKGH